MQTTQIQAGQLLPITFQLHDLDDTKFCRAVVRDHTGSQVGFSPVVLSNVGSGQYRNYSATMTNVPFLTATLEAYDDAGFTIISDTHGSAEEKFVQTASSQEIINLLNELKSLIRTGSIDGIQLQLVDEIISLVTVDTEKISIELSDGVMPKIILEDDENISSIIADNGSLEIKTDDC